MWKCILPMCQLYTLHNIPPQLSGLKLPFNSITTLCIGNVGWVQLGDSSAGLSHVVGGQLVDQLGLLRLWGPPWDAGMAKASLHVEPHLPAGYLLSFTRRSESQEQKGRASTKAKHCPSYSFGHVCYFPTCQSKVHGQTQSQCERSLVKVMDTERHEQIHDHYYDIHACHSWHLLLRGGGWVV